MARARRRRRMMRMMPGAFKVGQVVTYQGGSRARGFKPGEQVTVRRVAGGGARYRIQKDNRVSTVAAKYLAEAGMMPKSWTPGVPVEGDVRVDPIKVAKDVVASATVNIPIVAPQQVKLAENPAAILAMFNALLELPASAEAIGGESRRRAWLRMVQAQVMHGQYARQLR